MGRASQDLDSNILWIIIQKGNKNKTKLGKKS